mmetsp:Transcript_26216/g.63892  ORF Transcript_26216/g.63892 Transcript_26216/m.63892 type:complete len:97 (+) Transcript_26216:1271-1561(+)
MVIISCVTQRAFDTKLRVEGSAEMEPKFGILGEVWPFQTNNCDANPFPTISLCECAGLRVGGIRIRDSGAKDTNLNSQETRIYLEDDKVVPFPIIR